MPQQSSTITNPGLTAAQIKAMKKADVVLLHMCDNGTGRIELKFDAPLSVLDPGPIPCYNHLVDYEADPHPFGGVISSGAGFRACADIHYKDQSWQTICRSLKPGDVLHLRWLRGNNSQLFEENGFHCDTLHLTAVRGDGAVKLVWLIESWVGKDNCARLIKTS